MTSITLQNVGITATVPLFQNLGFTLGQGDRIGLIAGNGGGKTSLLKCIAYGDEPTTGEIVRSRGLNIGFVEQSVPDNLMQFTLRDAVVAALPAEAQETEAWRADVALDGFETPDALRDRLVAHLSGGWQRLMMIARIWVNDPDALLLDEPTNHLDLGKIYQLEAWLRDTVRDMPVLIASHDRDFLDVTTNRTLFLRPEVSPFYPLSYSAARVELDKADAAMARRHETDLKEAQKLRRNASKLTNIGINSGSDLLTVKAKQLKERAAKIENNARAAHKEHSGDITLSNRGTHAKVLVTIDDVSVTTPNGEMLFRTGKLHLFQGDRIVILGANGAGKSLFVKLLHKAMLEEGAVEGIKVTPSVVFAYVDQAMSQLADDLTPMEVLSPFNIGDARTRALLATAGFAIEKQTKPVGILSFGQKARLGLLVLRLTEPNFYLMDEPTNHVDIPAQERLEEEILEHQATCFLVSHDRRFVRNIGTRFLVIEGKKLVEFDSPELFFEEMGG